MAKPIPEGYHTVTPGLAFKDSRKAIEFYQKAFGAKVLELFPGPDGQGVMHAAIQIGNSIIMLHDERLGTENCPKSVETLGGSTVSLYLYVPNVDAAFKQAIAAGASETRPVDEMFWGDRCGSVKDPFGYSWMIATHTRDLTQKQIEEGAEAFLTQTAKK